MNQIVCISNHRWDDRPGRLDQLLRPLQDAEVLFFEPMQPFFSRQRRPREGAEVRRNVTVYTLPAQVDWTEDALPRADRLSSRNANYIFNRMMDKGFQDPLLWVTCPNAIGVIDQLPHSGLIYDCDRRWGDHADVWEEELCAEADVVFAASPALEQRLRLVSSNTALLENGLDYSLFSGASRKYEQLPADIASIPAPIVGILGPVDDFAALEYVRYTAAALTDVSFVFIGEVSRTNKSYPALKKLNNVYFLGEKSERTLPRYLSAVRVCLVPGSERSAAPEVLSACIYPYLATGRPIVAMDQPLQPHLEGDLVYYAASELHFLALCQAALTEENPAARFVRQNYARMADWSRRSQDLRHILESNGLLRPVTR